MCYQQLVEGGTIEVKRFCYQQMTTLKILFNENNNRNLESKRK
jgi:hypothetical protein